MQYVQIWQGETKRAIRIPDPPKKDHFDFEYSCNNGAGILAKAWKGWIESDREEERNGFQVITRVQLPLERVDANTFAFAFIAGKRIFVHWYKLDLILDLSTFTQNNLFGLEAPAHSLHSSLSNCSSIRTFAALVPSAAFRVCRLHLAGICAGGEGGLFCPANLS